MQVSGWIVVAVCVCTACSGSEHESNGAGGSNSSGGSGEVSAGGHGGGSAGTDSAGSGGTAGAVNPSQAPVILSFVATPPTLPQAGGQTTLSWNVQNADTLTIDQGVGSVTGTSADVNVTATTIFTLTATNANGTSTAATAVSIGANPSSGQGRYAAMVSPTSGESFIAPATLRLIASGYDQNVFNNSPTAGHGSNAAQVQFFVDDTMVLEEQGTDAEFNVFKGFTMTGIAAGSHRVWVRATCSAIGSVPAQVFDSPPQLITVTDPPSYGKTVDLSEDIVVADAGYALTGTAGSRIRLNGHGFKISSNGATASGGLTLQFVDVFDLGDAADTSKLGVDVTTNGTVTIEDSTFDTSNSVSVAVLGAVKASVQRNLFRSNMRMPLGQYPDSYTPAGASYPVIHFGGASTGAKVFAGNNVGAGWVEFVNTRNWTIGGGTDADSNVLIGPRVGIYAQNSSQMQIRRNYSHHVYYGGWSQGSNFELEQTTGSTIEHNVVYGSSWPVRGCATDCQFQYNLVLLAGHEWMQPSPGAAVHHNIFVGGDNDVGSFYVYNDPPAPGAPSVQIYNNTIDGVASPGMLTALSTDTTTGAIALNSNAFLNVPMSTKAIVTTMGGLVTTDYNGFFNSQQTHYDDGRSPAHDLSGMSASLGDPPNSISIGEQPVWLRSTTTANILAEYRTYYTPQAGSPLTDAGDPAQGAGNDIGAVGAGKANIADKFGLP